MNNKVNNRWCENEYRGNQPWKMFPGPTPLNCAAPDGPPPIVGTDTSSGDPRCRVFIGNLNTFKVTRMELEQIFQRHGPIRAISMHKGYGFVQFFVEEHARRAAMHEHSRYVGGQCLDCNLACEPKPGQRNKNKPDANSAGEQKQGPKKRQQHEEGEPVVKKLKPENGMAESHVDVNQEDLNTYRNPDIIVCGNCKEQLPDIFSLTEHKRTRCKLRFTCKCQALQAKSAHEAPTLLCATCGRTFDNSWDLVTHVQEEHQMPIYEVPHDHD
ncbi:PREDICTED: uncharacterized protein LOC106811429 isoform X2 [Priapulus caudatus]|uniref:Uncharacterized protein LOC106811429 isoform X2 n=1 Tax=Priapulus caudatus TaxID=37621 RepID=A0ABM1EEA3_PRICU|nr:PREDICTED: uncharacterized protein LOC106811429 isoform X2 [Priapulus caudatus]XP_014670525.1 PREDICTED: uncharacterized protein LOC106811429 isoform X2 [Priapulus caudatus]